jgi:hypothetical protein
MMNSLLTMYQKGAITADHLVVQCLLSIDPADPAPVLDTLPDAVLARVIEFARQYRPDGMVTNYGIVPAIDQVEAATRWIEGSRQSAFAGWAPPAAS